MRRGITVGLSAALMVGAVGPESRNLDLFDAPNGRNELCHEYIEDQLGDNIASAIERDIAVASATGAIGIRDTQAAETRRVEEAAGTRTITHIPVIQYVEQNEVFDRTYESAGSGINYRIISDDEWRFDVAGYEELLSRALVLPDRDNPLRSASKLCLNKLLFTDRVYDDVTLTIYLLGRDLRVIDSDTLGKMEDINGGIWSRGIFRRSTNTAVITPNSDGSNAVQILAHEQTHHLLPTTRDDLTIGSIVVEDVFRRPASFTETPPRMLAADVLAMLQQSDLKNPLQLL